MNKRPKLHLAMMCNQSNGGFYSGLTLARALATPVELSIWSLWGEFYPGHLELLQATSADVRMSQPVPSIEHGDHLLFYMNDYPGLFGNYVNQWKEQFEHAASVQVAFNRNLGSMPLHDWMAAKLSRIYFQNRDMQSDWQQLVKNNQLAKVKSSVLAPPVDLQPFLGLGRNAGDHVVIGRLAGDGAVDASHFDLYNRLAEHLPHAEFWFMPAPDALQNHFNKHPQFRFLQANEIEVSEFLQATDIYLLTYQQGYVVPGPRSLLEAMAAGCAPVVVDREGPAERVVHAESGFCATSHDEFYEYVVTLGEDAELRSQISAAARQRAGQYSVADWTDRILAGMQSTGTNR